MRKINDYLKDLQSKDSSLRTYYRIAQFLGVSNTYMYKARDSGILSDTHCIRIARRLGISPMEIISAKNYHSSKDEEAKQFWLEVHKNVAS